MKTNRPNQTSEWLKTDLNIRYYANKLCVIGSGFISGDTNYSDNVSLTLKNYELGVIGVDLLPATFALTNEKVQL